MTEIEQRRRSVSDQLAGHKIDALIVSSPANIRYLSGYAGSNGLMLISKTDEHFFTDPRYGVEASSSITCKVHVCKGPLLTAAAAIVKRKRLRKVGIEPAWLHVDQYGQLENAMPAGTTLVAVENLIENLRAIKSAEEIGLIQRSVRANSEAFQQTMRRVRPGLREREIAAELEFQMHMAGAEKPAFDTIVASGPRSALPHAHPTMHPVGEHELLLVDMGATLDGYTSDMTRVAFMGEPPKRILSLYNAVSEAQLAAIDMVREGVKASKVDAAARNVLKAHKLDRAFVHSTGHGLGLEIHEAPRIGKKERTRLQAGMVITIEPGAYIEGVGGVRIEDTVLVTAKGCEVMTPTPKRLFDL
ncbi:MAG TPA: Xaa-Pro peptidase family protein [Bryobacteraceae bacterium]|nr:Xaa-Pro peptidase family protein [Bryobacteraceae bacterium]